MQPQTKKAVFAGIAMAVERFGDVARAAKSLGVQYERFRDVANGKLPVPPQWVDALIALGDGRVSSDGFKLIRDRYLLNHQVGYPSSTSLASRPKSALLARYKLIRIEGNLRLLPPHTAMPSGGTWVTHLSNRPVYQDGKLKERFLSEQIIERHLII